MKFEPVPGRYLPIFVKVLQYYCIYNRAYYNVLAVARVMVVVARMVLKGREWEGAGRECGRVGMRTAYRNIF